MQLGDVYHEYVTSMRLTHGQPTHAHAKGLICLAAPPPRHGEAPVFFSAGYDGSLRAWRYDAGNGGISALPAGPEPPARSGAIFSLAASRRADGEVLLCAGSHSRRLLAWLAAGPQPTWASREHTGWVRAVAVASRRGVAYSVGCNRILGWSLAEEPRRAADRHPDAERIVLETASRADVRAARSHDILCLAHSDDDEALACGSVDGALRCWSALAGPSALVEREPSHWLGHADRVAAVAWEGGALLSCGYDGWVKAWRPPPAGGPAPWSLEAEACVAKQPAGRALCVASSYAGGVVLCGTSDGQLVGLGADLSEGARAEVPGRVTAALALPAGDRHVFIVGDSLGGLRAVELDTSASRGSGSDGRRRAKAEGEARTSTCLQTRQSPRGNARREGSTSRLDEWGDETNVNGKDNKNT